MWVLNYILSFLNLVVIYWKQMTLNTSGPEYVVWCGETNPKILRSVGWFIPQFLGCRSTLLYSVLYIYSFIHNNILRKEIEFSYAVSYTALKLICTTFTCIYRFFLSLTNRCEICYCLSIFQTLCYFRLLINIWV